MRDFSSSEPINDDNKQNYADCLLIISSLLLTAVFERLRNILHSGEIDRRVEYMIEVMFAIRKDGFKVREKIDKLSNNYRIKYTFNKFTMIRLFSQCFDTLQGHFQ